MKRILTFFNELKIKGTGVILFSLLINTSWGQVTLPHTDPLNYTVGQGLQTQAGWTLLNSGDDLAIASGSLSYPGITSTGNKVTFAGAGVDAAKLFTQQTSGTVYFSFLLNVAALGSLNTTGGYFSGFTEGTGTTFGATVWTRLDGAGYDIGINPRTTAANTVWSSGTQTVGTTLLVVIGYEMISGATNDVVSLWINPILGGMTPPPPTLTATNTLVDLANVNRILIRQDGTTATPSIEMDEFKISTSWGDVVLAVDFKSIIATKNNSTNVLKWQTASEKNNAQFNIERSNDGEVFSKIGEVKGRGNSNVEQNYTFTDASPLKGINYYRLRQVDFDGTETVSKTVSVNFDGKGQNKMKIYPTLVQDVVNVELSDDSKSEIVVRDLTGRVILTQNLPAGRQGTEGVSNTTLNLGALSSGLYILSVRSNDALETVKIQKY